MHRRRCLLALLALVSAAGIGAQPRAEYSIKDDQPESGSLIRRHVVGPIDIAINLPYHQLSPADRAAVHAQYERIAQGDEPPFPAAGLRALLDPIRQAQAQFLGSGDLRLIASIGADGKARQVQAIGSPSPELTRFAAQVLMLVPYKPAVCGGQPCTMDFPLHMTFRVRQ